MRDECHHGQLRRQCEICDLITEVVRLKAQLDAGTEAGWHALRNERDDLKFRLAAADALLQRISMESVNWVSDEDAVRCCNRIAGLTRLCGAGDE